MALKRKCAPLRSLAERRRNADGDVAPQAYALRGKVGLRYTW